MKFLVTAKTKPEFLNTPFPVPLLKATKEWIDAKIEDHTFDFSYTFPDGHGGFVIGNCETPEQIMRLTYEYPMFPFLTFEYTPLVDYREAYMIVIEAAEKFQLHPEMVPGAFAPTHN